MRIVLVGAGKVGYFLASELLKKKHEVVVIDNRQKACAQVVNDFGIEVICADASTVQCLDKVCHKTDMLVALTGSDECNLVTCQIAKRYFGVAYTISRINNPKNNDIADIFGVDKHFCSTDVIVDLVDNEIEYEGMRIVTKIANSDLVIVEFVLSGDSMACGKTLIEYSFVKDSKIVVLTSSDGKTITPQGDTVMHEGDSILMVCRRKSLGDIWKAMVK